MNEEPIETAELREYRLAARKWLAQNLPRSQGRVSDDPAVAGVAGEKLKQAELHAAGYTGFTFPTEYGGQGLGLEHERVFLEEAIGYELPLPSPFGVSINILGASLLAFANEAQKRRHIPKILTGEELWLQFLSEPSGGSDLAGLLTSATRDGDSYIVNGQKTWSTGAHLSDFALCPVRTRWDVPKHKGISMLIIDLKSPGIEIRRIKQISGASDFCEEFFTDVVVPASNLVGEENEGWRVARGLLEIEHAWVGRSGPRRSDSRDGVADLLSLAKERGLSGDLGVRRNVTALHVAIQVQKLVAARVSHGVEMGKLAPGSGGVLKLGGDILAQRGAEVSLNLAGAGGVVWDKDAHDAGGWAQVYLGSRSASIAGGTDEIQRNNVSERVLGLPREPVFDRDIPFNQVPHN